VLVWVNAGEEVAITRRRQVVANLTPAGERPEQKLILPDFHARLKRIYGNKILPAMTTQATLEDSRGRDGWPHRSMRTRVFWGRLIPTARNIWKIVETPLAPARSYQQSKTQMTLVLRPRGERGPRGDGGGAGDGPDFFTPLLRHELQNTLRLAVLRRHITVGQREAAWHEIERDLAAGVLHESPLDWPKALKAADAVSRAHTERLGARGMDILHVGSARAVRAKRFVTFDFRQRELVDLAGLALA
jgi:antitoxin (DNA-binding transcriptional repressor) of toxin-antitoxin stability system